MGVQSMRNLPSVGHAVAVGVGAKERDGIKDRLGGLTVRRRVAVHEPEIETNVFVAARRDGGGVRERVASDQAGVDVRGDHEFIPPDGARDTRAALMQNLGAYGHAPGRRDAPGQGVGNIAIDRAA